MTIEDSLILLNNTKQSIKTAIENKGVTVGSIPFAQYPGKIGDIPTGIELPEIGEAFGGGYFAGLMFLNDGIYASIISPVSTGQSPGDISYRTTNAADAGATDRVDTRINMAVIDDADHPAAQFCTGLTIGGKNDWVLPSPLQLMQAMVEFSNRNLMAPSSPMGFPADLYFWSSAQYSNTAALRSWLVAGFLFMSTNTINKTTTTNMRARAFRLEKLD